jgi:hypothetical protein
MASFRCEIAAAGGTTLALLTCHSVSCIAQYAERKSLEPAHPEEFKQAWVTCANCNQDFQGILAADLSHIFVDFVEKEFAVLDWHHLVAYGEKLLRLTDNRWEKTKASIDKYLEVMTQVSRSTYLPRRTFPSFSEQDASMMHAKLFDMINAQTYYVMGLCSLGC